jgi:hypothetical protein
MEDEVNLCNGLWLLESKLCQLALKSNLFICCFLSLIFMVLPSPNRISDVSGPASLGTRDGNISVLLPNRILTLHKIR